MDVFVVRIWTDTDASDGAQPRSTERDELHGIVRHVPTGTEHAFASAAELVERLRGAAPAMPAAGTGATPTDRTGLTS